MYIAEEEKKQVKILANGDVSDEDIINMEIGESDKNILTVIKSPVKIEIISLLEKDETSFKDLVKSLNKAKSTVSIHLRQLLDQGIVAFKFDPEDHRQKIFVLNSQVLGDVGFLREDEFEEQTDEFINENIIKGNEDFSFSRLLFHSLRTNLIQNKIAIDPIIFDTGLKMGKSIYPLVNSEDDVEFIENIKKFWEKYELGKINVDINDMYILITNKECYECQFLPKNSESSCFMELGIIKSLFDLHYNLDTNINEIKCFSKGDDCCQFEIERTF
ncbi:MAG: ArsR family transcriptional regulator [Methanobrevibacter sp.]|jgi:predicted hydrocarbon binding protein|nr:ArsR family transcriptional regulator [Candidatus Methanoflexus mossambicus]